VVEFHPDAAEKLALAALWYDQRREGLSSRFLDAVERAAVHVDERPESGSRWPAARSAVAGPRLVRFASPRRPHLRTTTPHAHSGAPPRVVATSEKFSPSPKPRPGERRSEGGSAPPRALLADHLCPAVMPSPLALRLCASA
jgi:hypothetical protein